MYDRTLYPATKPGALPSGIVQAKCACGAAMRGKNRLCPACQAKAADGSEHAGAVDNLAHAGKALPGEVLSAVQPLFDHDFSAVRIHDDTASHNAARKMDARAFTVGNDIHFGAGEYRPAQADGLHLLSHELAHTVQQGGQAATAQPALSDTGSQVGDRLEAEADRAADAVLAGTRAPVLGRSPGAAIQRQDKAKPPPKVVDPVAPSKRQQDVIDKARRAASIRTQVALFKVRGLHPHTGTQDRLEARRLAQIKFNWPNPNMDQIEEVVGNMVSRLLGVNVMVSGRNDPECGTRAGYVRGHRPPIVLCPAFFRDPSANEERVRTMIHEAAHLTGIGNADAAESYYPVFDCTTKGEFESADAWMHYVQCLSGQTPEEESITAGGGTAKGSTRKGGKN